VCQDPAAVLDRAVGAPAKEIEITPEMIKAGRMKLSHYRYDKSNEEEIVAAIFSTMMEARYW
jgi:hypothetical protein